MQRIHHSLQRLIGSVLVASLSLMVVLTFVDVLGRRLFNAPVFGATDITEGMKRAAATAPTQQKTKMPERLRWSRRAADGSSRQAASSSVAKEKSRREASTMPAATASAIPTSGRRNTLIASISAMAPLLGFCGDLVIRHSNLVLEAGIGVAASHELLPRNRNGQGKQRFADHPQEPFGDGFRAGEHLHRSCLGEQLVVGRLMDGRQRRSGMQQGVDLRMDVAAIALRKKQDCIGHSKRGK